MGFLIESIDAGSAQFRRQLSKLDRARLAEVIERLALLPRQDPLPPRLHAHQLTGRTVVSAVDKTMKVAVWSMHATSDDSLKASFTIEGGVAHFRLLASHAEIDRNP